MSTTGNCKRKTIKVNCVKKKLLKVKSIQATYSLQAIYAVPYFFTMERGDPRENFVFHGGGGVPLPTSGNFTISILKVWISWKKGVKPWLPNPPTTHTSRSEQWSIHAYKLVCGGCMWKLLKRLMCIVIPPLSQIPGSLYPFMLCVSWKWGETIACLNCKASNIWPNKKKHLACMNFSWQKS